MEVATGLNKRWGWFVGFGVVLIALGIFAVGAAVLTTLLSVMFLGVILIISGAVIVINALRTWQDGAGSFALSLVLGILYLIAGILLIKHPASVAMSITLLLAIFYMVVGFFRILGALSLRVPRWGWGFFSGAITLILGILILAHWPASGLFVIGLFIGIDLILYGWSYVLLGLATRSTI